MHQEEGSEGWLFELVEESSQFELTRVKQEVG